MIILKRNNYSYMEQREFNSKAQKARVKKFYHELYKDGVVLDKPGLGLDRLKSRMENLKGLEGAERIKEAKGSIAANCIANYKGGYQEGFKKYMELENNVLDKNLKKKELEREELIKLAKKAKNLKRLKTTGKIAAGVGAVGGLGYLGYRAYKKNKDKE